MKKLLITLIASLLLVSSAHASRLFDGDNDTLRFSGAVFDVTTVETIPITVLVWVKRTHTSFGTEEWVVANGTAAGTNNYMLVAINTDNTVSCRTRTSASNEAKSTATIADTTTWHMILCVFAATNSRTVYVDANAGVNDTGSRDPTVAPNRFSAGGDMSNTPTQEYYGNEAYLTVWGSALSGANATSLWNSGSGVDPTTISNGTLISTWDLTGNESPEVDDIGAFDLTVAGPTFSSDNPFTVGGGGGTGIISKRRRH